MKASACSDETPPLFGWPAALTMEDLAALSGLFLASFLAATLLPAQSEAMLVALHWTGNHDVPALLAVATIGNVLGSIVNWLTGRYLIHFQDRRWFPVKPDLIRKATIWYQKWGFWSLLLAWAPLIGDPLTLVAGVLRENFWIFLALVTFGKMTRYVLILMI